MENELTLAPKVEAASKGKVEEQRTETLRVKLHEILGIVPSPRTHPLSDVADKNLEGNQPNPPDTIETDSDCTTPKRPKPTSKTPPVSGRTRASLRNSVIESVYRKLDEEFSLCAKTSTADKCFSRTPRVQLQNKTPIKQRGKKKSPVLEKIPKENVSDAYNAKEPIGVIKESQNDAVLDGDNNDESLDERTTRSFRSFQNSDKISVSAEENNGAKPSASEDFEDVPVSSDHEWRSSEHSSQSADANTEPTLSHVRKRPLDGNSNAFTPPTAYFQEDDSPSLNETQDDDLQRVVMLLGLALGNFKNKMDAATKRKTSEILLSSSEDIKSHLANISRQIHSDLGEIASANKTHLKRFHGLLKEKEDYLMSVHEKFRAEINHHLRAYIHSFEGFRDLSTQVEEALENQKVLHKKLVLQAEETINSKVIDAENKVIRVFKSSREKMLKLQCAIADCLEE